VTTEPSFKYCHPCGFEYYAFVEVCTECGAELTTEPLPEPVADESGVHTMGQIDVDELTEDDRSMLTLILRGSDVPFELTDTTLIFPESRDQDVRTQLELVTKRDVSAATPHDPVPPAATVASVARGLRVREGLIASRSRRLAGWYIDSIVIGLMARIVYWLGAEWWAAVVVGAAYVVAPTAVSGRTLGKAITRIHVVDERTDAPPSWLRSGSRWFATGWAWIVALLASSTLNVIAALVVIAMFAPILWDRRGRGLHDRIAGTVVVRNPVDTWLHDD
jgi:uncharacterized RDD family membrane protein YckC